MTPEDQRIAVAEAHGFKWYQNKEAPDVVALARAEDDLNGITGHWVETTKPTHGHYACHNVPDYLTDLQAIHEAIMTRIVFGPALHQYQSNEAMFEHQLNEISEREQVPVWYFDASLYCEALLKTLKTWKD